MDRSKIDEILIKYRHKCFERYSRRRKTKQRDTLLNGNWDVFAKEGDKRG